jgi:hypothetical protein
MSVIVLDQQATERLQAVTDRAEVRDANGRFLGLFTPLSSLIPPMSLEELDRRAAEPGGRPLADILRDLESRA